MFPAVLWRIDRWAEEAGAQKQEIRVRLDASVIGEGSTARLRCVVKAAGVVEVVR